MVNEVWTKEEIRDKMDNEGGWLSFYYWGGLLQRTGDTATDGLLTVLQDLFTQAERVIEELNKDLGY